MTGTVSVPHLIPVIRAGSAGLPGTGYRFVWAAHALLDVSPRAVLRVPGSPAVRLYPEAAAFIGRSWPLGAPFVTARWPGPGAVFDLAEARREGDAVTIPPVGYVEWELEIDAAVFLPSP